MKKILLLIILAVWFYGYNADAKFDNNPFITYQASLQDKGAGTFNKDGYYFFISEIEMNNKRLRRLDYEGRCLLKTKSLIKDLVTKDLQVDRSKFNSYSDSIKNQLNDLVEKREYVSFSLKQLRGRVLVNSSFSREGKKIYKYVFAVKDSSIEQLKKSTAEIKINDSFLVNKIVSQARKKNSFDTLIDYYKEMGLWEDAIYFQRKLLEKKYSLKNYYQPENPFKERLMLRKIITSNNSPTDVISNLKKLPANIETLDYLIDETDNLLEKVVYQYIKLPVVSTENIEKIYIKIDEYLQQFNANSNASEFLEVLLESRKKLKPEKYQGVLRQSLMSHGHLIIEKSLSNNENKYFLQAQKLFFKGGNKAKTKNLLIESINQSPRHDKSWNYLGALMTADGKIHEALAFHLQAYQINNENIEAMAHISDCYYRLGKEKLASSYADYLSILNQDINNRFVNKVVFKIKEKSNEK